MFVEADQGSPIPGLAIPRDLYWVLRSPAPLAGMRLPQANWPWSAIHAAGFLDLVTLHPCNHDPTPMSRIFAEHLEDLFHGGPPKNSEREVVMIRSAVRVIVSSLRAGRGVIVHCWGGRGRTGTVLGCALRELGYDANATVDYLDRIHVARGKEGWPESPWQSNLVRQWKSDA